jgi:hypothetical protein
VISAVNSIRNPRPDAAETSTSNATLTFTFWNQSDNGYKVMTPIYTYNPTLGRPELANNSYGEILYFDKSFFENPSFMKLWSYNLTFRIVFMGATGAASVRPPRRIRDVGSRKRLCRKMRKDTGEASGTHRWPVPPYAVNPFGACDKEVLMRQRFMVTPCFAQGRLDRHLTPKGIGHVASRQDSQGRVS